MRSLTDGQKITYDIVQDRRSGKSSADNLGLHKFVTALRDHGCTGALKP